MEGSKDGRVRIEAEGDMREPYMGNTVPVKVYVDLRDGKVDAITLVNPEGIQTRMQITRGFIMKQLDGEEDEPNR